MILVICGYARSGKTTVVEHLRSRGWHAVSSSETMHSMTRDLFALFDVAVDTDDKQALILSCICQEGGDTGSSVMTTREFMSGLAEGVLVKNLGRGAIIREKARQARRTLGNVVIEVYNQEEYDIILGEGVLVNLVLAIRSHREKPGIDSRDLIHGALEFSNDGSVEELTANLDRLFSK